jgi:hypothetical protein
VKFVLFLKLSNKGLATHESAAEAEMRGLFRHFSSADLLRQIAAVTVVDLRRCFEKYIRRPLKKDAGTTTLFFISNEDEWDQELE